MNTPRSTSASGSTSTSTPVKPPLPATGLSHSHSLPVIPTITTPPASRPGIPSKASTEHLRSPQTPASTSKNKNFHPYLIQTTASSLLSRSNASPVQPIYEGGPKHRVSRSMSALNKPDSLAYASSDAGSEERTPGKGSPNVRKGMRRSGTLPSFNGEEEDIKAKASTSEDVSLPSDPKAWTPSELGRYLQQALRSGKEEREGPSLPPLLIEDIKTWVLRHQVTGKAFLQGPESWTTSSRPPPFLPLLTSIRRRLRRSSLQSRILSSTSKARISGLGDSDFGAPPSVLLEEDSHAQLSDEEAGDEQQMTGVKRMAHAYDAFYSSASASEASGDDSAASSHQPLKQQWTGEGQRRDGWKRWEAEMRPLRRQDTGSSIGSIHELNLGTASPSPAVPMNANQMPVVTAQEEESEDDEALEANIATIKARPGPMEAGPSSVSSSGTSPPPPYASPNLDDDPVGSPQIPATPEDQAPAPRSASHSATPTGELRSVAPATSASPSPSISRLAGRQSLGLSTSRRLPKASLVEGDGGAETDDERERIPTEHYSSARRVTIRPAKSTPRASSIFTSASASTPAASTKTQRELDLEQQLAQMADRLKELENKLDSVLTPPTPTADGNTLSSYLLGRLGLVRGDDGLPKSMGELPAYLFLVGFGVGAVVVRVLFTRSR